MHTSRRLLQFVGLIGAALCLGACAPKTINQVLADPARYAHHAVTLRGEVLRSYSVLGRGIYELRDHTGRVWVASDRGVPREGTRVQVKGVVRDLFDVGSLVPADVRVGTIIDESSRKTKD